MKYRAWCASAAPRGCRDDPLPGLVCSHRSAVALPLRRQRTVPAQPAPRSLPAARGKRCPSPKREALTADRRLLRRPHRPTPNAPRDVARRRRASRLWLPSPAPGSAASTARAVPWPAAPARWNGVARRRGPKKHGPPSRPSVLRPCTSPPVGSRRLPRPPPRPCLLRTAARRSAGTPCWETCALSRPRRESCGAAISPPITPSFPGPGTTGCRPWLEACA